MISPFNTAVKRDCYTLNRPATKAEILAMAKSLIQRQFDRGKALTTPTTSKEYLMLQLAELEHEVFCCIFLDNQHRVIAFETLAMGTIDAASIYPREVLKRTLHLNAKALIFAHNNTSGIAEPSKDDRTITKRLVEALTLIEVRVHDQLSFIILHLTAQNST